MSTMTETEVNESLTPATEKDDLLAKEKSQDLDPVAAKKALATMSSEEPAQARVLLRVYPKRWIILLVVALLNNSNTMIWISYASIANFVDTFYETERASNWFSMIYLICTIPFGLLGMWVGRVLGLRVSILIAAWSNAIGAAIKLGAIWLDPSLRFPVAITGQAISAIAYPFIMSLPTKVGAAWFPENERAIATTIAVMSNPLGILLANIASPNIVNAASSVWIVNVYTFVPAAIACLIASVAVTSSDPPHPPALSASKEQMPFVQGVKSCFTNKSYLVLLVVMGGGIGMFNCLYTVMQQLLCPYGYSNQDSGLCAALMIIGGVIGATLAGSFVAKTHRFAETLKVALGLAVVCGIVFLQLTLHAGLAVVIFVVCFLFGVMGLATYPVGLELSAEVTFPVAETTSTSLVVIAGQIQSIVFLAVMSNFAKPLEGDAAKYEVCSAGGAQGAKPNDFTVSNAIMSGLAALLFIVTIAFFHPEYRRMNLDQAVDANDDGKKLSAIEDGNSELKRLSAEPQESS